MRTLTLGLALMIVGACGGDDSSSTKHDAAVDTTTSHVDAPTDSGSHVFMDAPAGMSPLKVKNILAWCTITVNGGAETSNATITVNVAPGVIPLTAKAKPDMVGGTTSQFKITSTMWHHTDGDSGGGEGGTVTGTGDTALSSTNVTVGNSDKCVWICCPFKDGSGCPSTDQCP